MVRQRIRARVPGGRSSGRLPFKDIERKHSILDIMFETVQGTGWGTSKDSAVFRVWTVVASAEEMIEVFSPNVQAA